MQNNLQGTTAMSLARGRAPTDEDDSDSELEAEDDHDAAKNLLHIRDPNRWARGQEQSIQNLSSLQHIPMNNASDTSRNTMLFSSSRVLDGNGNEVAKGSEYSITRFFEPKFLTLFAKYSEAVKHPIDLSRHLMSLCLDHLVPFSCWARENANRSQWIKTNLEDNIDLRPEVRNGLAMILIYVFSSAQSRMGKESNTNNSIDMFSVLQDADNGLGIVNKTSLKIYNDPFGYFNFLKSCISGLIDAGKIPENERQNQPKKPKRQTENKEEVFAYMQLKGLLVALLGSGEVVVARAKVQQVMSIWQQRSKIVRNRRFATALAIVSNPSQLKQKMKKKNGSTPYPAASLDINGNGGMMLEVDNDGLAAVINGDQDEHDDNSNPHLSSMDTLSEEAATAAAMSLVAANMGLNIDTSPILVSDFASSFSNHQLPPAKYQRTSLGSSSNRIAMTPAAASGGVGGGSMPSISVLRFERVGATEWEYKEIKVYNLESLIQGFNGTFCLMDETRLSTEDKLNHRVSTQNVGFISLPNELQQRGALLSSWPKSDHGHLLDFLECWLAQERQQQPDQQQQQQPLSLLDFWHMNSVQGLSQLQQQIALNNINNSSSGPNSDGPSPEIAMSSTGQGIIAYEIVMQVGFVLRKNEALGIGEDCWRLIYPRDLQSESSAVPFGQFLSTFFPQMRSVMSGIHDLTSVVVKYFPHALELPVQQPPRSDAVLAYQTIGTLDEPAVAVLARFEMGLSFHDVVIQST